MIKWIKDEKMLELGPNWYIQFLTRYRGLWALGIVLENDYYSTLLIINLFKLSIHFGRSKV